MHTSGCVLAQAAAAALVCWQVLAAAAVVSAPYTCFSTLLTGTQQTTAGLAWCDAPPAHLRVVASPQHTMLVGATWVPGSTTFPHTNFSDAAGLLKDWEGAAIPR